MWKALDASGAPLTDLFPDDLTVANHGSTTIRPTAGPGSGAHRAYFAFRG